MLSVWMKVSLGEMVKLSFSEKVKLSVRGYAEAVCGWRR